MKIVIGTRGSELALRQTALAAAALRTIDPSLGVETRVITTRGDVNFKPIPLDTVGKGWFTEEIEQALLQGEIDLAVHSLKDMAVDMPHGLSIGAYLPREDARDALITTCGEPLEELPRGAVVGTDSVRRQAQMLALRPDLHMESLRGNVVTRLQKLQAGGYDAIILAAAGLKRLGLEEKITRCFSPSEMTPAPGQGILALQSRQDDSKIGALLSRINDESAASAAHIERSFSRVMGGGCKAPVGAYAAREGGECVLIGMLQLENKIVREELRCPAEDCEQLGETLARALLAKNATAHGQNA